MATELGKFLRKLRIDADEILLDMANRLGVAPSFLSSVENGKKRMPSPWLNRICELYALTGQQKTEFERAVAATESQLVLSFENADVANRELAVAFARDYQDLSPEQVAEIRRIMRGISLGETKPRHKTSQKFEATGLSRDRIAQIAFWLRKKAKSENDFAINIVSFIENTLPNILQCFEFEIVGEQELENRYAETELAYQGKPAVIRVQEKVYKDAVNGIPRAIFTLAHELGHLLLHTQSRITPCSPEMVIPAYKDPEWQANTFAGELLVMRHLARGMSVAEIADKFHVSYSVAVIQKEYSEHSCFSLGR